MHDSVLFYAAYFMYIYMCDGNVGIEIAQRLHLKTIEKQKIKI